MNLPPREPEVDQLIEESFVGKGPSPKTWVIKWNGRIIRTSSGKSSWRQKQHASSALTNHLAGHWWGWTGGWGYHHAPQPAKAKTKLEAFTREVSYRDYAKRLIEDGVITIEQI